MDNSKRNRSSSKGVIAVVVSVVTLFACLGTQESDFKSHKVLCGQQWAMSLGPFIYYVLKHIFSNENKQKLPFSNPPS